MQLIDIQMTLGLSGKLARILLLLNEQKVVTQHDIVTEYKLATDAKVAIHRLRRALDGKGVDIKSRRDVGYWLEPSTKERIKELADTGQTNFVLDHGAKADVDVIRAA